MTALHMFCKDIHAKWAVLMQGPRHAAQSSGHAIRSAACHDICVQLLDEIRAASQLGNCFAEI